MAEEPVNNKTFKDLIEEQKKTTSAILNQMNTDEETSAKENIQREKSEARIEGGRKAWETRQANLLKQNSPDSAKGKEVETERNSYLRDTFKTFLGKGSSLAKGLGSIGEGLKAKVKGGLEGIFAAIKAGAFVAFLGAVVAFLRSDLFKDMKDKYLPVIADGVKSLFDTLKGIVDGFFDEDGNFSAAAGFKNIFAELSTAFTNFSTNLKESFLDENGDLTLKSAIAGIPDAFGVILGAFINPVTGLLALLAPRMFFGSAVWIGKKLFGGALRLARGGFGLLFRALGSFTTALDTTAIDMDGQVSKSKKTGAFRRGLGGTGGKFRRLFRVLGKFGGLLGGVGLTMLSFLDPSSLGKVFTTVGDSFKSLFGAVKDFGSKVTNSAFKMGQNVIDAGKTGVFSIANGIGTGFTKLFNKVSSFGTSVSNTVSGMGEAIKNSNAFSTVSAKFSGFFGKVGDFGTRVATTVSGIGESIKNSTAFSTVSTKFSGFFGKVGDFGTKVADRAKILGESVTNSSVFKALSTTFDSLFGVITNFGKEIGKVASAAAGATADAVKSALKSVASIGAKKPPKPVKPTRSMMDAIAGRGDFKIKPSAISTPKVTTNLGDGAKLSGSGTVGTSPKYSSSLDNVAKAGTPPRLATLDTVIPKVPMMDLKSSKIIKPKIKLTTESMTRSFLKRGGLGALKMIPIAGAIVGLGAAAWRSLTGDLVGGAAELAGVFAPSVAGLPIDAGLMARDMYKDQFGVFPEEEKDKALAAQRMKTIAKFVKDKISNRSTSKSSKAQVRPQENSSDTIDFSTIKNFSAYKKVQGQLRVNPAYDLDNSGAYSRTEFRAARNAAKLEGSGSPLAQGPMFLAPTSNVVNNKSTYVMGRPITDTSFGGVISSR